MMDSNILVFPSSRTLREYQNAIRLKVGFNPDVINELKNGTKNLNGIQRFICVCFDEIKVQSSLVFNKYTDEHIDFIDLGDPDTNYSTFSDLDKLASHILVYHVRGFCSDLKFAFAYFAAHGVTSLKIMTTFWKAISVLEITCKFPVITVLDGALPNRKFYSLHAPLDELNTKDVTYRKINLFEPKRYIWFFADAPHLLKTAKNCIYHSGNANGTQYIWKEEDFILWDHLRKILDDELENDLKLNPKLTINHIQLSSFLCINTKCNQCKYLEQLLWTRNNPNCTVL